MKNTKLVGDISESKVLSKLLERGEAVSIPFGDNSRYDLISDRQGGLVRIQCKTGRLRNGVIDFDTASFRCSKRFGSPKTIPYIGQVDEFAVYCPELDKVFLVPIDEVGPTKARIRLKPTKSSQKKW